MRIDVNDALLIAKIGHMYYHQQMSQTDIADRLGLSRFQVSRLIKQGLDEGIIVIQIYEPTPSHNELADALEKQYGLRSALLVDGTGLGELELKQRVATAAGRYLTAVLGEGDVLGVSLGSTIQELVAAMPSRALPGATLVQLIGGGPNGTSTTSCDEVTRQLAQKLRVEPHFLYAPAIVDNQAIKQALESDSHIQATYSQYKCLSVAVLGVGAIGPDPRSRLVSMNIISPELQSDLVQHGAVGDVLHYIFDRQGQLVRSGLEERVIGIPLDDLLVTPLRIGVAGGVDKADAILGALRGQFINALVTDHLTARAILERTKDSAELPA